MKLELVIRVNGEEKAVSELVVLEIKEHEKYGRSAVLAPSYPIYVQLSEKLMMRISNQSGLAIVYPVVSERCGM